MENDPKSAPKALHAPGDRLTESGSVGEIPGAHSLFENREETEWLNSNEAARYLRVTPNALRIMVCRNKIEPYWLAGRQRFRLADLRSTLTRKRRQR